MNSPAKPWNEPAAQAKARGQAGDKVDPPAVNGAVNFLADLTGERLWVAWREEISETGKPTKIPKNPATDNNAKVPTDPATYGTRDAAEQCWQRVQKPAARGGIGIVLGPLPDGLRLVGIDLDSCLSGASRAIADDVVARF